MDDKADSKSEEEFVVSDQFFYFLIFAWYGLGINRRWNYVSNRIPVDT